MELSKSALRVMNQLWEKGELPAKTLCGLLHEQCGWNKNTTYTVIKKCVEKEAIERREPNFQCHPLVSREQVREQEAVDLVDKLFDGSAEGLFAALLSRRGVPQDVVQRLRDEVERASGGAV